MVDLNLNPENGDEVRVLGRPGVFRVFKVYQPGEEHSNPNLRTSEGLLGTVDLKQEEDGFILPAIPWYRLRYVDKEIRIIRRLLESLKQDESFRYPFGITDFRVDSEERYDGEPQFVVRFIVDSAVKPTREKVWEWNEFTSRVRERILASLDLDRWVQVMLQQEQEAVNATV